MTSVKLTMTPEQEAAWLVEMQSPQLLSGSERFRRIVRDRYPTLELPYGVCQQLADQCRIQQSQASAVLRRMGGRVLPLQEW